MDSQEDSPLRIKALDGDNWLEPDPVSTSFAQLGSDGVPRPIDSTEWNRLFLAPRLSSRCPEGVMVAFEAPTPAAVDAAYDAGIAAGGTAEGPPGDRTHYGEGYYGAYLRDVDGNKVHFACRGDVGR